MIQRIQKLSRVAWDDVQVRLLRESDIDAIVDYYYQKKIKTPSMGIDVSKLPPEALFRERYEKIAAENSPKAGLLIVEYKRSAVGLHPLRPIYENHAEIHAHFWDPAVRGKGMVAISGYKSCAYYFQQFGFERILIKAPKDNPLSMAASLKLPLKYVGEEIISSPMFPPTPAMVYEITREAFESLS